MSIIDAILIEYQSIDYKVFSDGTIVLQNDGKGDYIKEWNYSKPIPSNMELLKVFKEQ